MSKKLNEYKKESTIERKVLSKYLDKYINAPENDKYGFGGWLKDNAGGLAGIASTLLGAATNQSNTNIGEGFNTNNTGALLGQQIGQMLKQVSYEDPKMNPNKTAFPTMQDMQQNYTNSTQQFNQRFNQQPLKTDFRTQFGLGGWLKQNAGTIGSIAGGAIGTVIAPGIGTSIGAGLGGQLGGLVQATDAQNKQDKLLDAQMNKQIPVREVFNPTGSTFKHGGYITTEQFQQGGLTEYNGATHEQGGIGIGNNKEVEGNETRNNNYIFSNAILADTKKRLTYADLSKAINRRFNKRNDNITNTTKQLELDKLAEQQEIVKQGIGEQMQMRLGGKIKYDNGGRIQQQQDQAKYGTENPYTDSRYEPTNEQINEIPEGYVSANYVNRFKPNIPTLSTLSNKLPIEQNNSFQEIPLMTNTLQGKTNNIGVSNNYFGAPQQQMTQLEGVNRVPRLNTLSNKLLPLNKINNTNNTNNLDNLGKWWDKNKGGLGEIGLAGLTQLGSLYDIGRGLKGVINPEKPTLQRISAPQFERIDPTTGRKLINEQGSIGREMVRQSGNTGIGSYLNNINSIIGGTQRNIGQYESDIAAKNAQIQQAEAMARMNANQFNANQYTLEDDLRQREKDIASNTLQKGLTGLSEGIGTELVNRSAQKNVDKMFKNTDIKALLEKYYKNK